MVHVAVGNENVADPQHLPRRKRREIAGIEQQGAPTETEVNEQDGIAEGSLTSRVWTNWLMRTRSGQNSEFEALAASRAACGALFGTAVLLLR